MHGQGTKYRVNFSAIFQLKTIHPISTLLLHGMKNQLFKLHKAIDNASILNDRIFLCFYLNKGY